MSKLELDLLFPAWESELKLLLETKPTCEEFWDYWREREDVVESLVRKADPEAVDAAFNRLFDIAERSGFMRLSKPHSEVLATETS